MDANEPVVVHATTDRTEAEIIKNALENEGIECVLDGENQGSFTGVLDIKVLVRASDAERAREFLGSHASKN